VAVVLPVIATLANVHATACVHPNVTINELLLEAARVIRAAMESLYSPGNTDEIENAVAEIDAAWVEAVADAMRFGVVFTRSANASSQYRIACVTRPVMLFCVTGVSTTYSGTAASCVAITTAAQRNRDHQSLHP
tara:strand:- start:320 stop:724 length:405 start_codon:yes stop_codon:yes gene_type:complete